MTPMVFAKGLAGSGCWGDKLFGRLVSEELPGRGRGHGLRKASRAKVIYGLEPVFESGRTCIIKVSSLLLFGPGSEASLLGRNYDVTIQVPRGSGRASPGKLGRALDRCGPGTFPGAFLWLPSCSGGWGSSVG